VCGQGAASRPLLHRPRLNRWPSRPRDGDALVTGADTLVTVIDRVWVVNAPGVLRKLAPLAVGCAFASACGGEPTEPVQPPRLEYVAGNNQEAPQGELLPAPFVVRATDRHGVAYPGAEVRWTVEDGISYPADTVVRTDGSGIASLTLRLPKSPGPVFTLARLVAEPGAEVRFKATARRTAGITDTLAPDATDTTVLIVSSGARIIVPPGSFAIPVEVSIAEAPPNTSDPGAVSAVRLSITPVGAPSSAPTETRASATPAASGRFVLAFPATVVEGVLDVVWVTWDLATDPYGFAADAVLDAGQRLVLAYLNAVDAIEMQAQHSRYEQPSCDENYRLRTLDQPSGRAVTVILIHGWQPLSWRCSQFAIDVASSTFERVRWLHGQGWLPSGYFDFRTFTYPTYNSPDAAARKLRDAIESIDGPAILVGHSMGGLVARRAAQLDGSGRVRGVVTLGTPHRGTPLAGARLPEQKGLEIAACLAAHAITASHSTPASVGSAIALLKLGLFLFAATPGLRAMTPGSGFLNVLNDESRPQTATIGFAGDLSQSGQISALYRLPHCLLEAGWNLPENDGIVPRDSALPPTLQRGEPILHFDHTDLTGGTGDSDQDAAYFEQVREAIAELAPAWIQGRVSAAGASLAGVTMRLLAPDADSDMAPPTVTDAEGRYALHLIEPGEYRLMAEGENGPLTSPYQVILAAGDIRTVDFALEAATVDFASLTAGGRHTCGTTTAGAHCWGYNYYGQLGEGSNTLSFSTPQPVSGDIAFAVLTAGGDHTCGITLDGTAYCWGNNGGRLGDGTTTTRRTPVTVLTSERFASLSAGFDHTCGVTMHGTALCWGDNSFGQLGDGGREQSAVPVRVAGEEVWRSVASGQYFTCGLTTTARMYCWGSDWYGSTPSPDKTDLALEDIVAGGSHVCGLTPAGDAYCRGNNLLGQLGNPAIVGAVDSMVPVASPVAFVSLAAGKSHTCGIAADGAAYCWGYNFSGQLGTGTNTSTKVPLPVVGGLSFVQLAGGDHHTCGVTPDGAAYCWGSGGSGQLGTGSTGGSTTPVQVVTP
jgi:alpha-tubulin suppressor-like RCC1 family protein/pimeloyl-ACP methyl ester carboxylesterase